MEITASVSTLMIAIGTIVVLLVLSAFFSGSETALTAASRSLIHQLERKGNWRAGLVNKLCEDKESLIGSILVGNNLVNILASVLATSVLIGMFGEAGVVYATIIMTVIVIAFAELLPKTYAIQNADRVSLAIAPVLRIFVIVLSPVARTLQISVRTLLRLVGIDISARKGLTSAAEMLRGAIDLHSREEPSIEQERVMLSSILDLADVDVSEIMVHRNNVAMVDVSAPSKDMVQQIVDSSYTRIPLWRDKPENIIGVLHAKALLKALQSSQAQQTVDLVALASPPWFIPETTHLLDQLQAFRHRREHFAIVVDEYGAFMGIVTLEDILEEIVGDISDEHDTAAHGIRRQLDRSAIVDGAVTIRDLNREFDWQLPDEDAATVAGLVIHESRQIPDMGQVFVFHEFRFEILQRRRNQITSVRVTPPRTTGAK